MPRAPRRALALLLALAATAGVGRGSRPSFAGDPPSPSPAPAPAPVAAPDDSLGPALATLERHAVRIHFTFQRDLDAEARGVEAADPDAWTEQLRRWRMTWRITGFVVRDRRTVVSADHFSPPGAVKSIEIRTLRGTVLPVLSWEFLSDVRLCVFRTATDLDVEPVPFSRDPAATKAPLVVGNLSEGLSGLETWAVPLSVARRHVLDVANPPGFDFANRPDAGLSGAGLTGRVDLVLRPGGEPVGLRIGASFDLDRRAWSGPAVLSSLERSVPIRGLVERAKALHDDSFVHEVRLTYRKEESSEGDGFGPSFGPAGFGFGGAAGEPSDDERYYGLSIAPDLLLVPRPLPDAWVRRIEKLTVEDEGDPVIQATYEGRVKGTGAFLVRLAGGTLEACPFDTGPAPAPGHAFLVHRVAHRAGARRDTVTYDRSLGFQLGYGDRPTLTSERPVPTGSFLMDVDGKLFGVATELRPEDAGAVGASRGRRGGDEFGTIAALFSEGGGPLEWAKSIDRRATPKKSEDAKRLPWLGVEYVAIHGADVAEALDVSAPTRDGTRGFLVNVVHAGSPAARAGIRRDDLLLAIKRTSGPGADAPPVDLKDGADEAGFRGHFSGSEGTADAPWSPRRNALVRLLEALDVGTTYELELWRDGASKTLSLTVELSPRDVDSALKQKDEATGLTVKELTYEVREALHLAPDAPGVLICAVEDGMAAFQARIAVNELIREMDGVGVESPEAFAKGLAQARAAGKPSVRVVVQRLDRTRFVDLRLTATEAAPVSTPRTDTPPRSPPK